MHVHIAANLIHTDVVQADAIGMVVGTGSTELVGIQTQRVK